MQAHLAAGQQLPEPNVPGKAWPKFDARPVVEMGWQLGNWGARECVWVPQLGALSHPFLVGRVPLLE